MSNKINPKVIIEPTDTAIKIIVGYVLNKKPVILYANTISTNNLIKNGNIIDMKFLIYLFKNISHLEVEELKLKLSIKNIILIFSSMNLNIFKIKKNIRKKINSIEDISLLIEKEKEINKKDMKIVDIKPLFFYTNDGKTSELNEISNCTGLETMVYMLPKKIVDNYNYLFENSKIKIQKRLISSQAISYLLPYQTYIYVDIGFNCTNISLISKKILYESHCFKLGGSNITKLIVEKFHASFDEAEKIKRVYGYTEVVNSFNPIIFSSVFDDQRKSYTILDLNNIIKDYLDEYFDTFDKYLNMFFLDHQDKKNICPIIIGGGGSKLNGLKFFFKKKYDKCNINFVKLDVIGARHEKYLNCVGALLC